VASIDEVLRDVAPHLLAGAQVSTNLVMIRCPFHGGGAEKTPSCSVSRVKPVFFCHSCGTGGHISRLMREAGVPTDLAKNLAQTINYDYSEFGGRDRHAIFSGQNPYRGKFILDDDLLDGWRLKAVSLEEAGFSEVTMRHFEVGFDNRTSRITFPLRNVYGELIGVSGRSTLESETGPRYKIYSAKDLAHLGVPPTYSTASIKGALLWHGHLVLPIAFNTRAPIVVCEGFKAAMWVWQHGFHNVVALVGAHLTKLQAELFARTASEVILFLDNNTAGWKGTLAAGNLLIDKNLVKVARYPDLRQQPDALHEADLHTAIKRSQHFITWRIANQNRKTEAT